MVKPVSLPEEMGELIHHRGDHTFHTHKLTVQTQQDDHEEKQNGPERGSGQLGDRSGVSDEGQAWT